MKANEMDRYTFLSGLSILAEHPDGEWVLHSDAMQVIQALEAKIKGMIERPNIEVVNEDDGTYRINGIFIEHVYEVIEALGMEGSEHD